MPTLKHNLKKSKSSVSKNEAESDLPTKVSETETEKSLKERKSNLSTNLQSEQLSKETDTATPLDGASSNLPTKQQSLQPLPKSEVDMSSERRRSSSLTKQQSLQSLTEPKDNIPFKAMRFNLPAILHSENLDQSRKNPDDDVHSAGSSTNTENDTELEEAKLKRAIQWEAINFFLVLCLTFGATGIVIVFTVNIQKENVCTMMKRGRVQLNEIDVGFCAGDDCEFDAAHCAFPCPFGFYIYGDKSFCPSNCECGLKGLFAGDILFDKEMLPAMLQRYGLLTDSADHISLFSTNARIITNNWWNERTVQGKHQIPYTINNDFSIEMKRYLLRALANLRKLTCIDFVPWHGEAYHVDFANGLVCGSAVGKWHKRQTILLSPLCTDLGSILHEIMHLLGFDHEHSHPDRDNYVTIHNRYIDPKALLSFMKQDKDSALRLGARYDVKSVMHYDGFAFTINVWDPTITDKQTNEPVVAQRDNFTTSDLQKINELYKCPGGGASQKTDQSSQKKAPGVAFATTVSAATAATVSAAADNGETKPVPGGRSRSNRMDKYEALFRDKSSRMRDTSGGTGWESGSYSIGSVGLASSTGDDSETAGSSASSSSNHQEGSSSWGAWQSWEKCIKTCGTGEIRRRFRYCELNIQHCTGKFYQYGRCGDLPACPESPAAWGAWNEFGHCSKTCDRGLKLRKRDCPVEHICQPGNPLSSSFCNTMACPVELLAHWQPWNTYGSCSKTCGIGRQYRNRFCLKNRRLSFACVGEATDIIACNSHACSMLPKSEDAHTSKAIFSIQKTALTPVCTSEDTDHTWIIDHFDGDDKVDIMCGPLTGNMKLFFNIWSNTSESSVVMTEDCGTSSKHPADFNGDDLQDILCISQADKVWHVKLSEKGTFEEKLAFSGVYCLEEQDSLLILDSNGDGRADLLCRHADNINTDLALNQNAPS